MSIDREEAIYRLKDAYREELRELSHSDVMYIYSKVVDPTARIVHDGRDYYLGEVDTEEAIASLADTKEDELYDLFLEDLRERYMQELGEGEIVIESDDVGRDEAIERGTDLMDSAKARSTTDIPWKEVGF